LSASATIPLTVSAAVQPSFTLSATAATANAGASGTSTVTIIPANGFGSGVTLATSGWPAGITGTFGTNPATGSSIVTINVATGVAAGPYALTVTGNSSGLSASTTIALTVNNATSGMGSSASFVGVDATTEGAWTGRYGTAGYVIANDTNASPSYATVGFSGGASTYTWAAQTTDPRAPQSAPGSLTGIASAYTQYSGQSFTIDIGMFDSNTHTISFYLLDWDSTSRTETITILDAATNTILDSETFSGFHNGQYATWNIKGSVIVKVTPNSYISPVVSGIFFH
jgi:hypothetical protein